MNISCLLGNLRLREAGIRVDWLDSQLKKKLQQLCEEEPLSISVQGGNNLAVPRPVAPCLPLEVVLERLNMLCWKLCLRIPVFLIKCVLVKPNGWQKFWYQVAIPGFQVLVTGFTWVFSDRHGLSEYKAKVAAALHALQLLN